MAQKNGNKPLTLAQFETIIDTIEFCPITKFSRYDAETKKRVESNNGRKVDLKTADGKMINIQPVSKLDDALKSKFGGSYFQDADTGKESYTLTVCPDKTSQVFQVMRKFDDHILAEGKKHPEWFREAGWKSKSITDGNIEGQFLSTLKEPEPDKETGEIKYHDYQWKMTFYPSRLGVCIKDDATGVFKNHQKDGYKHIMNKSCDVMPCCSPAYVWFTGQAWGIKWFVNMVVVPKMYAKNATADFSCMLGMEGINIVTVEEEALETDIEEPATPRKRPADALDGAPPKMARPSMAPPSMDDVANLFEQC